MAKYRCLIVDDEPIAIRVIKRHLSHFDNYEVVGECVNAIDAMRKIRKGGIDLLFLDIEMPTLTGMEMLKTLPEKPHVIFTTAHRNYAVDAFEINALDYLLKPVSLERFAQAVNRFEDVMVQTGEKTEDENVRGWVMIRADQKNYRVPYEDIFFIESMGDYVQVHLKEKRLVTKERISQLDDRLPSAKFLRVHRGYIINKNRAEALFGNTIEVNGHKIPVGRSYREKVSELFS